MAASPQRGLFNLLAWLDAEAANLSRATSWLQYPYFTFARYRHLQPSLTKPLDRSHLALLSGRTVFRQNIRKWLRRIRTSQQAGEVMKNLKPRQRSQLAALVADSVEGFEAVGEYLRRLKWHKQLCALAHQAPSHQRVREQRLSNARSALGQLLEYEKSLPTGFAESLRAAAADSLKHLPERVPATLDFRRLLNDPELHAVPTRTANSYMVALYWFFREGCGLSGDDSEVRVALIRNTFWPPHGVPAIAYRSKYVTGESKGCDAVNIAVRRFRRPRSDRGTPR